MGARTAGQRLSPPDCPSAPPPSERVVPRGFPKGFPKKLVPLQVRLPADTPIDLVAGRSVHRREERDQPPLSAPHHQRTKSAHLRGDLTGKGQGRQEHPAEVRHGRPSAAPGRDLPGRRSGCAALVMLGQAGWHMTDRLLVPDNITLLSLPPKASELNPVENVWQLIRENWLSNRVFRPYHDTLDRCQCLEEAQGPTWCVMSLGLRQAAYR